mmetsp:Transcript_496/g.1967  ORF Transcript_496/g.1967 Transcript_496/m.1967 type:complete len:308 (-) Transcript_496:102-1025(-)
MGPQRALHQPLLEALLNVPGLVDEPLAVPKVHRAVPHELGQRELLDLALPALQPVASAPLHNNPRWRVRGPAAIHVDGPTLAADVRLLLGLRPARVVGRPEPLVAKPQRDSSRHVGTLAVDCGGGIRAPEVGGVKGQEDPGDRIETEVQKSSSSDLQIVESSHLLRDKKSEVRGDAHDLSEVSRPEDLRHPPRGGKATGPEPLHQEETLLLGQREHRLDLPGVHSHGLLAQDVLAGPKRRLHCQTVVRVDISNVHDGHILVREEVLVRPVGLVDLVLFREGLAGLEGSARTGDHLRAVVFEAIREVA